ncbi:DNA adenine methylase [Desulfurispora thermophila]|uniref:DNA adenine methylase n=1 Tax=Desulfurispora thermophila TaxID=265470 RepID=UPI0004755117|nr:DNA adenine methylase [Desulfurispora thermophila]
MFRASCVRPPVKWAGGKSQLIPKMQLLFPRRSTYNLYIEPFLGGGAVFFHLQPERAVLIDSNPELMNFYQVVREKLPALLADLTKHVCEKEYYYYIRDLPVEGLSDVERASRFLFLNKTAYNGLWRVNRQGKFNVPFGRYANPRLYRAEHLQRVSVALQKAELICGDFSLVLDHAAPGAFVYFDPPYHPLSETSRFTSYTAGAFGSADQRRLSEVFRELDGKGCLLMLSNSDTPLIRELYAGYNIYVVQARRNINCQAKGRGAVDELIITNYLP